jgi:hypothetical protein
MKAMATTDFGARACYNREVVRTSEGESRLDATEAPSVIIG